MLAFLRAGGRTRSHWIMGVGEHERGRELVHTGSWGWGNMNWDANKDILSKEVLFVSGGSRRCEWSRCEFSRRVGSGVWPHEGLKEVEPRREPDECERHS